MKKKVAIVGCGLIAEKKHVPAFVKLKEKVEIVAVCDLNEALAKKLAAKFGIKKCFSDFLDMLKTIKPDIVNICTPPQTHAKLAILAMENGAHVIIEKPMALTTSDCEAMIEASNRYGKKIGIIHNQLFNPTFIKAKKIVNSGELGDFVGMQIFLSTPTDYITSTEGHWAHKLPGGILGETGPHSVYLASAFLKNIYDVNICAKKLCEQYPWSKYEDFRFNLIGKNGICSITQIYSTNQWAATIDIFCSRGLLKIDLETRTIIIHKREDLNKFHLVINILDEVFQKLFNLFSTSLGYFMNNKVDPHFAGIKQFLDSVDSNTLFPITPYDGKEVVKIMEMVVKNLNSKVAAPIYN